jgi:hypothetical protein
MSKPIPIKIMKPAGTPQDDLLNCYFVPNGSGEYNFHDPDHKEKAKDKKKGESFSFDRKGNKWTLSIDPSSTDDLVTGTWSLGLKHIKGHDDFADDQTYTAQAEIHVDKKEAASANA